MMDKALMGLSKIKQIMGMLAGLAVLQALFIIGQAYTLATVITHLWEGKTMKGQGIWLLSFFIIFLARHGVTWLRNHILDRYAAGQAQVLRKQLLEKVFRVGPSIVQDQGTGNMTTMALEGINQVENYIHLILVKMMNLMIVPWIILAFIFYLDMSSGWILIVIYPLIILFMVILGYAARAKADRQYASFQILANHFIDSLRGLDTLKMFGISKRYGKSIYQTSEAFRKSTMSTLKIAILSSFALDFFTTLSVAIVAVLLGLRLLNGVIFLFPALTVLILAPEYFLPIRDFSADYHATLDGKNAMTAIREVLETPETVSEPIAVPTWNENSTISVDNLSLDYEGQSALTQVAFSAKGFQKIGVIGMSGSGKSTLMDIISGFLTPSSGNVMLNQHQLSNFTQQEWQKQLLYIPQHPYIFQLSLRENLTFYTPEATETEIRKAIEVVGLAPLVAELPEGLETQLGGGARTLSGGQAQRIALARAFLDHSRKVLVFDEPTAHLDIETELEIKEGMLPLMENRLVFFATHRLHWMHQMDYIIVLKEGEIIETGTFDELVARNGHFYDLTKQMRRDSDV